jgi:hypothetical protein
MGAVPTEKAGVGSAVNDATRLFGAALGVAVFGSIAASLYGSQLAATIPHHLPAQAAAAARGSVGGALVAAQHLTHVGLVVPARQLGNAAIAAFLHGLSGTLHVGGAVALLGAVMAATLLPARPRATESDEVIVVAEGPATTPALERAPVTVGAGRR